MVERDFPFRCQQVKRSLSISALKQHARHYVGAEYARVEFARTVIVLDHVFKRARIAQSQIHRKRICALHVAGIVARIRVKIVVVYRVYAFLYALLQHIIVIMYAYHIAYCDYLAH